MDKIIIDLKQFQESKLDLLEYLVLLKAYHFSLTNQDLKLQVPEEVIDNLEKQNYIKRGSAGLYIRELGLKFFEDGKDQYFKEFFDLFPKRVSNDRGGSRILSPVDIETTIATEAYKKWRTITRNDTDLKKKIIACLNLEIQERSKQNGLPFMHNIITWLNKRYYQMYEDKLDLVTKTDNFKERTL